MQTGSAFKVLIPRERIQARVTKLASEISRRFAGQSLLLVPVLKGARVFASDLARQLTLPAEIECVGIASYGRSTQSSGEPELTQDLTTSMTGRNVLIVDDILDSGLTLTFLTRLLRARAPRSLAVAVLLDKPARRVVPFTADHVGFTIGNEFVIGYGMDFNERYRELPDICVLPPGLAAEIV